MGLVPCRSAIRRENNGKKKWKSNAREGKKLIRIKLNRCEIRIRLNYDTFADRRTRGQGIMSPSINWETINRQFLVNN